MSLREAATWSGIWVGVSCSSPVRSGGTWTVQRGVVANAKTLEFVTGYLIEKSLAVTTCSSG